MIWYLSNLGALNFSLKLICHNITPCILFFSLKKSGRKKYDFFTFCGLTKNIYCSQPTKSHFSNHYSHFIYGRLMFRWIQPRRFKPIWYFSEFRPSCVFPAFPFSAEVGIYKPWYWTFGAMSEIFKDVNKSGDFRRISPFWHFTEFHPSIEFSPLKVP